MSRRDDYEMTLENEVPTPIDRQELQGLENILGPEDDPTRHSINVPDLPEVGQDWEDTSSPGMYWRVVESNPGGMVYAVLYDRFGDATDAFVNWPWDRWGSFVQRQQLRLG